jgi:hypothetical protein
MIRFVITKNLFQLKALHNSLIEQLAAHKARREYSADLTNLLQRSDWRVRLAVASRGERDRPIRKEMAMFTIRKLVLSAAIVLSTTFALATSAAFANAPGGAYIKCDGGPSSPVRCVPDGW